MLSCLFCVGLESHQTDALVLTSTGHEEADNIRAALVEAMVSSELPCNQHVRFLRLPQQWDTSLLEEGTVYGSDVITSVL